MSLLFILNVLVTAAALRYMFLNHTEILEGIEKSSDPKDIRRKKLGLCLLWFVTVVSVISLPLIWKEDRESKKEIAALNLKAENAGLRAELTYSNNLVLETRLAEVTKQLVPRVFIGQDESATKLARFSGTEAIIFCDCNGERDEISRTLEQIKYVLIKADWKVAVAENLQGKGVRPFDMGGKIIPLRDGVTIDISRTRSWKLPAELKVSELERAVADAEDKFHEAAEALVRELNGTGIKTRLRIRPEIAPKIEPMAIYFGARPIPVEFPGEGLPFSRDRK